jgi:hypothetical protein
MATYYSQKDGAWSDMTVWKDGPSSGSPPANLAAMDDSPIVIQLNNKVHCDVDMSGFAGLQTVTITSHTTTPGMLYWKDSSSGHLKMKTGNYIVGTNAAVKGRILANSDGTWRGVKGLTVTGSESANTLTAATHGLPDTTLVSFFPSSTSSVLPAPLQVGVNYFVRDTAENTFKVALTSGGTAIDLTTDGTGTFGVDTCLALATKAVIELGATSSINAQYLDVELCCSQPVNKYAETYGVPFIVTFANATEKFTIVSPTNTPAIPPNGTPITLSGTLPAELTAGTIYFVKAVSGATGELEATIGGGTIAITGDGSGTIYMHYGCWGPVAQATEVNTTTGLITWNGVPPAADTIVRVKSSGTLPTGLVEGQQYYVRGISGNGCKLSTVTGTDTCIVIPSAVGSGNISMYCGSTYTNSKVVNVVQDVATADPGWSTTTGHNRVALVSIGPAAYDQQRDLLATIHAKYLILTTNNVDSTQYPLSRVGLSSRNVSIRSACTTAISICDYANATTSAGVYQCEIANSVATGTTFSGYALNYGTGHTVSGTVFGCSYGINYGTGHTVSGTVFGCSYGINYGTGHTVYGTVFGCTNGINYGIGHTVSGTVFGCSYGINYGTGHTVSGTVFGCNYGLISGIGHTVSGKIGYNSSDIAVPNATDFMFGASDSNALSIFLRDAKIPASPVFNSRNTAGVGSHGKQGVYSEDHGNTPGASVCYQPMGTITKVAINSGGDAPTTNPLTTTTGHCLEVVAQTNCSTIAPITIFENHKIWLAAGTYTITYAVQTTYSSIAAGALVLTCRYMSDDSPLTYVETTNAPAITTRTDANDWTNTLHVHVTQAAAGWVDCKMLLYAYEASDEVYVWPVPVII